MYPIYLNSPSFIFISLIQSWPLSFTAAGTHADQWSQEIVIDSSYCHSSGVHAFCAERGDTGPRYKHCCKLCHIHLHTHTKSRALELCGPFIRTRKNLKNRLKARETQKHCMDSGYITEEYHRTHKHSDLVVHVQVYCLQPALCL